MLTILVPIKEGDYTDWGGENAPIVSDFPDFNTIYRFDGTYYRKVRNEYTGEISVINPVDREFPYIGKPLEIFDFTYDAERMGSAPTISAQNVMWYAEKDESGNDVTLEGLWRQDCHVSFNGENLYLKLIPTSVKSNEDARYRYDIDFVSEIVVLERVYLYDVVMPFVSEKPISESSSFSFYGDIKELITRINASMIRSGLAKLQLQDEVEEGSFLSYEEFNKSGIGSYEGDKNIYYSSGVTYFEHFEGDYNQYLRECVYLVIDDEYVVSGYKCVIGKDKDGEDVVSEEKLVTFDNNTIHEALQQVYDTFELQYYIKREGDKTLIVIGDNEHEFSEDNPFDYGVEKELLSKEKNNTTDKIVNRITGVGGSENIPWYYPNPMADGWIKPMYKRGGEEQSVEIDYPKSEGVTDADSVKYEKYLNNRIGDVITYGRKTLSISKSDVIPEWKNPITGTTYTTNITDVVVQGVTEKVATFVYNFKVDQSSQRLDVAEFKIEISGFQFSKEYSSITYKLYNANGIEKYSNVIDWGNGGLYDIEQDNYYLVITVDGFQYDSEIIDNVYYYYPTKSAWCSCLKTWGWREILNILSGVFSLTAIRQLFNTFVGFDCSMPSFLSPYPNLKFVDSDNAKEVGWYLNGNRIDFKNSAYVVPVVSGKDYYAKISQEDNTIYKFRFDKRHRTHNLQIGNINPYNWFDVQQFFVMMDYGDWFSHSKASSQEQSNMDADEVISSFVSFSFSIYCNDGWYKNGKKITSLSDYAIALPAGHTPVINDTIEFKRLKYITPQPNLLPEVYIKTDGERRFYNAHNYEPLSTGTPDDAIGEELNSNDKIINHLYDDIDTEHHYDFENEYIQRLPNEHIENFDDVKPTIKGQKNTMTIGGDEDEYRIDVVEEFAFDQYDNDEVWEDNSDGSVSGEYKHPYFFAKLRPLGFNIFDMALQEDMVLSMTTGHCGACNFKICVDESTQKNPVQIWEQDVYELTESDVYTKKYNQGDIRRVILDTSNLYYKTDDDEYVQIDSNNVDYEDGFLVDTTERDERIKRVYRKTYSSYEVTNGEVGMLKKTGKKNFEGDVITNGRFIQSQQDTSENFVWVALMKDTETYGAIMPSATPDYNNNVYSTYIDPKGHTYTDRKTGITSTLDDDTQADKFVLLNIKMPQVYLRRAERELSRKLIKYMYDNNYQKFNFSISLSRIFLAQNVSVDENLNQNSVLYVSFNNKKYRQYVKHYSYKMTRDVVLPEIIVDMNEELSVSRTFTEKQDFMMQKTNIDNIRSIQKSLKKERSKIEKVTIGKNEDVVVNGNIISRDSVTSINTLKANLLNSDNEFSGVRYNTNIFKKDADDFNTEVAERINQIKYTIEERVLPLTQNQVERTQCTGEKDKKIAWRESASSTSEYNFWYTQNGQKQDITGMCVETYGMEDIEWQMTITN